MNLRDSFLQADVEDVGRGGIGCFRVLTTTVSSHLGLTKVKHKHECPDLENLFKVSKWNFYWKYAEDYLANQLLTIATLRKQPSQVTDAQSEFLASKILASRTKQYQHGEFGQMYIFLQKQRKSMVKTVNDFDDTQLQKNIPKNVQGLEVPTS